MQLTPSVLRWMELLRDSGLRTGELLFPIREDHPSKRCCLACLVFQMEENFAWIIQGSLNYQFAGNQTMQMYGNFRVFPYDNALFGLVI